MDFAVELQRLVQQVEHGIDRYLPPANTRPSRLHEAMRYSLQAGGKRLRPVLLLASAEMCGMPAQRRGLPQPATAEPSVVGGLPVVGHLDEVAPSQPGQRPGLQQPTLTEPFAVDHVGEVATLDLALPAAVAIECLHTYSLIHDDLPCMDNDDLRRGRPTAHKAFDEATALLAGDALLTHAFCLIAEAYGEQPMIAAALIRELGDAAGSRRLIGGQMEDLLAEKKADATAEDLEFIHLNKTAAMIEAALVMGGWIGLSQSSALGARACSAAREAQSSSAALGARASYPHSAVLEAGKMPALPAEISALRAVGRHLGLAFQIVDDVLDATADSATLGKTAGKDAKADKTTFVKLHGLERSRQFAREHTAAARAALASLDRDHAFLDALIDSLVTRAK